MLYQQELKMIKIFYGPTVKFKKVIEKINYITSLTKLLSDLETKKRQLVITDNSNLKIVEEKDEIENLVVSTEEYSRLSESGINSFNSLLSEAIIENMYLQNPPEVVVEQLKSYYEDKEIEIERYEYKKFNEKKVKKFFDDFSLNILGQEESKNKLTSCLYKIAKGYNDEKPMVILLYGPTGVGKTETVKFLSGILRQKLFRKQFSMYQNNNFYDYVFGSNHSSTSLARDLLERESNIILFDEFDKTSTVFYSAFYQMFDEGEYIDKNYRVDMRNSIIFCTSNFLNIGEIKKVLGVPMFSRFDSFVEYKELSEEVSKKIIQNKFDKLVEKLTDSDKENICREDLKLITEHSKELKNVREIDRVINEFIFNRIINNKFNIKQFFIIFFCKVLTKNKKMKIRNRYCNI